jgi:hypothetical protein
MLHLPPDEVRDQIPVEPFYEIGIEPLPHGPFPANLEHRCEPIGRGYFGGARLESRGRFYKCRAAAQEFDNLLIETIDLGSDLFERAAIVGRFHKIAAQYPNRCGASDRRCKILARA